MAKSKGLSAISMQALEYLQEAKFATIQEMKQFNHFEGLNSAHLTALRNRELVESETVKLVCDCCGASRKVLKYTITEKGMEYGSNES